MNSNERQTKVNHILFAAKCLKNIGQKKWLPEVEFLKAIF
jgi:hypothetical protein